MRGYLVDLKVKLPLIKARISGRITFIDGPPMPGLITKTQIEEDGEMLVYKLGLPAPGANDVVARELSIQVGPADPETFVLAPDATEYSPVKAADGEQVAGNLVDVDDAGNRSEPRVFQFTAADTIAPPQPGEIVVELVGEE